MDYRVVVTKDAEEDLDRFLKYLILEKQNVQAAQSVLNDYDVTIESLKRVAGSLKLLESDLSSIAKKILLYPSPLFKRGIKMCNAQGMIEAYGLTEWFDKSSFRGFIYG